ncbi:MAG: fumarylacetoacetate hydrolase family protein [Candidatus Aminicenantia bacterium]
MKICRLIFKGKEYFGLVEDEHVFLLKEPPFEKIERSKVKIPLSEANLIAPVNPSKIIGIAYNYKMHAMERRAEARDYPLFHIKPSTSVIGPEESILLPKMSSMVDFGGELAIVIKRKVFQIKDHENPMEYVLGYTCINDVTARDIQDMDKHFTRAKCFDTFSPLGPWIVTELDPSNLKIKSFVNGRLVQSGNTKNMTFSVDFLIRYLSQIMTLLPGDVIATGTPSAGKALNVGDVVDIQIDGIGVLSNNVLRVYRR